MMAQEEPVYMGPYQIQVMRGRRRDVVALAIAPVRSVAGKETDEQRKAMFLMLEPWWAVKALAVRALDLTGLARERLTGGNRPKLRYCPFVAIPALARQ